MKFAKIEKEKKKKQNSKIISRIYGYFTHWFNVFTGTLNIILFVV